MTADLSLQLLLLLGLAAFVAGFIDTLAGGGGLITVPALFLAGLPPILALGTNKLQGLSGSMTASLTLIAKGALHPRPLLPAFALAFAGACAGTLAVRYLIDPKSLDILIPIVLMGIGLYFLLAPKAGEVESRPRLGQAVYERVVVPVIGFYDGFLGPGTGSFFALGGVALRGKTVVDATTTAKFLNFATNIGSFAVFALLGKVVWTVGLVMAVGQIAGANLGAHVVVGGGARFIRPLIVTMCFLMLGRYLWQKGFLPF